MSKEVGHSPEPTTDCPVEPPMAMSRKYGPYARTTAVSISAIQISRTGPDGLPALPLGLKQPINLTCVDPENRGRSIGQQLDDLLAAAERQSLEEWKDGG